LTARSLFHGVIASAVVLIFLLLILLLLIPLTETGTRWLLTRVGEHTPITVDYERGTIWDGLHLHSVSVPADTVDVHLERLVLELNPGCLWNSRVCFRKLSAHHVEVHVRESVQSQPSTVADDSSDDFEFPVVVYAPSVEIESLQVSWPGGSWQNQRLSGALTMLNAQLQLDELKIQDGSLELEAASNADTAESQLLLPDIELPFVLVVDSLELIRGSYDIKGESGTLMSLALAGEWEAHTLALETLSVVTDQAELGMSGNLRMRDSWLLQANVEAILTQPLPSDPLSLNRLQLSLAGDLSTLAWEGALDSTEPSTDFPAMALTGSGEVDVTQAQLPMRAQLQMQWLGDLSVSALLPNVALPEDVVLRSPVRGSVNGDLQQQHMSLDLAGSGMGYDALTLSLQSSMAASQLVIESLTLSDKGTATVLKSSGTIRFEEDVGVLLDIESTGVQLPSSTQPLSGRIAGSATLTGNFQSNQWLMAAADVALHGEVNELPAKITGALSMSSERLLVSANLDGELNGAVLHLHSQGAKQNLGTLELKVDDIGRWIPDARGRLAISATTDAEVTRLVFTGEGGQLGYGPAYLHTMQFEGSLSLARQWLEKLSLEAAEFEVSEQQINDLKIEFEHELTSGIDTLAIKAEGDVGLAIALRGKGDMADWKGALAPTQIVFSQSAVNLEEVGLHWAGAAGQLTVEPHCWRVKSAAACFDRATLGSSGRVSGTVGGDMSFLADLLPGQQVVEGLLSGSLAGRWSPGDKPALQLGLLASDVAIIQNLGEGQQARLDWNRVQMELVTAVDSSTVQMTVQRAGQSRFNVDASMEGWGDDAPLSGSMEVSDFLLENLQPFVPSMSQMLGQVSGAGRLTGTFSKPEVTGSFGLQQGALAVVGNPTTISDLALGVELKGRQAVLNGSGMVGDGALTLSGQADFDPQPRLTLNVGGDRKELQLPPSGQALVSQDLTVVATTQGVEVTGQITVHEGRLEHEQLPEGSVDISSDAIEVDYAGNVVREKKPFDLTMDIDVKIEDRFAIVGTNIDTTVGGDLRLRQRSNDSLQLFGNLNVIGGELRAYGQSLKVKRGAISFAGATDNPQLDLRAERVITLEDIEVGIHVIGPLEEPELEIYSNPAMSQTEALSYLLRGRGLDAGTGGDGTAVALSVGTSIVNQSGVTDSLNRIPGLSNIGFGAEGSADETAATVSGYIGERIYVSYGVGLYEPINTLTARLYLQTRLWLEVVSRLENSVDLYYSFDID